MADIPIIDYDVPYFNQVDLGLGGISLMLSLFIGYLFSSLRSPIDFGLILQNVVDNIVFLNSLVGITLQSPITASIGVFTSFALAVTLTILFYDVGFGGGLSKFRNYSVIFVAAFIIGIPYSFLLSLNNFVEILPVTLVLGVVIYFVHVGAVALGREFEL